MPSLLTFAHGARSRGDGFIKTPSSGMWQCTLLSERILREEKNGNNSNYMANGSSNTSLNSLPPQTADGARTQNMDSHPLLLLQNPRQAATVSECHLSQFHRQFQLISTSCRYLCSILVADCSHTSNGVRVMCLQKISPKTRFPDGVGVVFASAAEASWADVLSFMHQSPMCLIDKANGVAVWRLAWEAPSEKSIGLCSVFLWRVTSALPLSEHVEVAFGKEAMVYIAVGKAGGAIHTPRDRKLLKSTDPPPLLPKPPREGRLRDRLGQRNLSRDFTEAKGSCVGEGENEREAVVEVGVVELRECKLRQPTYAEVLKGNSRVPRHEKTFSDYPVHNWRRCLIKLRDALPRDVCTDVALQLTKSHVLQQEQQQVKQEQQQRHQQCETGNCGSLDTLVLAALKELLCDVLLEISWCQTVEQRDPGGITLLLEECTETAEVVGRELKNWSCSSKMLQFPCYVQQLRLVRHRCLAMVLLGQSVGPALLQGALRLGKRLLELLRDMPQEERDVSARGDDTNTGQVVCGVLSAALALLEVSLLVRQSVALRADMTWIASLLLLWLRDATTSTSTDETNLFTLPVALIARVSDVAAVQTGGRLNGLRRRCEDGGRLNGPQSRHVSGTAGLCCGIVRPAWCSAVFDQQFARTLILVRRCDSPGIITAAAGGESRAARAREYFKRKKSKKMG